MRYLSMIVLSTAALGFNVPGRFAHDPSAYGAARWAHGQLSTGGPAGWFLVRDTPAGPVVYAVDQPSGQKLPSYTHYRGPAQAPSGFSIAAQAATNGVLVGAMQGLAGHGPLLVTDGSEASDVEARKVMEEVARPNCPPDRPCPNQPDPEPDAPDDDDETPPADYRRYAYVGALLAAGCVLAYGIRRKRSGL